ncbi:TATA box-binding protein-associated factor RNA polymerase I subunit B [Pelobates fuscus]|uniref:TATA box-binding protein-associated factor RNA polymerase I subunit B n=1 Tax=Pelobates fuscus TaxID=191477 RepID=UPI002FE4A9D6
MDDEDTRDYKEPCPQCSEVNWGLTEESKFYCKSCHTVIEKTKEIDPIETFSLNSKMQSINRGLKRKRKDEKGWDWFVCEAFQFILQKQAEALQKLGVDARIKDDVICNLWRRYLQKNKVAYVKRKLGSLTDSESNASFSEPDSELEAFGLEDNSTGGETSATDRLESATSVCSGSVDGRLFVKEKNPLKMSMPLTLAFCYLSLLWLRESITLSDLLRFVFNEHIPYMKAEQYIPDEIKMHGPDIHIFHVQCLPEYNIITKKTFELGTFLDLPRFPPITENCYLHPNVLCMKYLMEANLPDELHVWTSRVAKKLCLDDATYLTFDPLQEKKMVQYDVQSVALIIVVLKLLFVLDDHKEWALAECAFRSNTNKKGKTLFDYQEWYKTMKVTLDKSQRQLAEENARFIWKSNRVLYYSKNVKGVFSKRKRMARNLHQQFSDLAESAPDDGKQSPSSFLFNWEEENIDMTCFHGHSLEGIMQHDVKTKNSDFWLSSLKKCRTKICKHWTLYDESNFPRSYHFVLSLFCFMLRLELCVVHHEVCSIEYKLFNYKFKGLQKNKERGAT